MAGGRPETYVKVSMRHSCGHGWDGWCQERDKEYWLSRNVYECGDCMNGKDEDENHWARLEGTYLERYIGGRQRSELLATLHEAVFFPRMVAGDMSVGDIDAAISRISVINDARWFIFHCLALPMPTTLTHCIKMSRRWRPPTPGRQAWFTGLPKTERDFEAIEESRRKDV